MHALALIVLAALLLFAGCGGHAAARRSPGEVRCHNVRLNGGYWWVVGADAERRP